MGSSSSASVAHLRFSTKNNALWRREGNNSVRNERSTFEYCAARAARLAEVCYAARMTNQSPEAAARDAKHWEAVEQAAEIVADEQYKAALGELRAVIEADPTNPYAYNYLGVALYELGELEPARDAYRAAIAVSPKYLGARISLSHVLRDLGEAREALKHGMIALSDAQGDGDALHAVGMAYLSLKDFAQARRFLEAFLSTHPEFEVATEVRAILTQLGAPNPDDEDDN